MRIAEEKRLEEEREKREQERREQEMKEIRKQQAWDRVDSLRGTDVGKRAFKNLSAKVCFNKSICQKSMYVLLFTVSCLL